MRFKLTLILLLANLVVFYLIWSLGRPDLEPPAQFELPDSATVDRISVEGKSLPRPYRFEAGRDGRWAITSPVQWPANVHALGNILSQLQLLRREISFPVSQIEARGLSLADYGLADPSLKLSVGSADKDYVFEIGARTQIGQRVYMLSPKGDLIIVAPDELLELLSTDIEQLRAPTIFTVPTFEVRGLSIRIAEGDGAQAGASAQRVGLVKTKDGWRIETPVQADADARMVESQIAALEALQANRFIQTPDASPAAYGLTNPAMRVSLEGNQRQTLLLGRSVPQQKPAQYYAQLEGNPAIFTVNAALFDALKNAQELLRERHILPFDPAALSAIDIVDEHGARVRLQVLENGSWQVMGEANGTRLEPIRADDNEVARLVGALRTLKAGAFTNDAPTQENLSAYGFDKPLRTVTLSLQNSEPLVLTLGSMQTEEGKLLYARTNRAQGVYQVHPAILMLLSLQSAQYRWRVLEQLPAPAMLTRLSLKDLSAGKVIFEGNPAELPKELDEAKKAAVQQIAAALKNFEVAQYLEKSSDEGCYHDGRLLPWRYELTGSAALSSGADAKTQALAYRFTARQGGTVQGGFSAQSNTAFLLAQPLIDALFTLTDEAPAAAPAAQK